VTHDIKELDEMGSKITRLIKKEISSSEIEINEFNLYNYFGRIAYKQDKTTNNYQLFNVLKDVEPLECDFNYIEAEELESICNYEWNEDVMYNEYLPPFLKETLDLTSEMCQEYFNYRVKKEGRIYYYTKLANSVQFVKWIARTMGQECRSIQILKYYVDLFDGEVYTVQRSEITDFIDSVGMIRVHTMLYCGMMELCFPDTSDLIFELCKWIVYDNPHIRCKILSKMFAMAIGCLFCSRGGYPIPKFVYTRDRNGHYNYESIREQMSWIDEVEIDYTELIYSEFIDSIDEFEIPSLKIMAQDLRFSELSKDNIKYFISLRSLSYSSGYTITNVGVSFSKQCQGKDELSYPIYGLSKKERIEKSREDLLNLYRENSLNENDVLVKYVTENAEDSGMDPEDWILNVFEDEHYFPLNYDGNDANVLTFIETLEVFTSQITSNLKSTTVWNKEKLTKEVFNIQTSRSGGAFNGSISTSIVDIPKIRIRKKNMISLFFFKRILDLKTTDITTRLNLEYGQRTVPGGKGTRMIMVDSIVDYYLAMTLRPAVDTIMKSLGYKKPTGVLLKDAIQQMVSSSTINLLEIDTDYSKYDGSIKTAVRQGMRHAIKMIDYLYDDSITIGELNYISMLNRWRHRTVIMTPKGPKLMFLDMIESGEPFTSVFGSLVNRAITEIVISKIHMDPILKISLDNVNVQGDDSAVTGKIENIEIIENEEGIRTVRNGSMWNSQSLFRINDYVSNTASSVGMEANDKGGVGNCRSEYLKKYFILGIQIPNPRIQLFCIEKNTPISIVEEMRSIIGLYRLMIERGYYGEPVRRYVIMMYLIRVAFRFNYKEFDGFIQPKLSSILTPNSMGGVGFPFDTPSLHVFPNVDLYIKYRYSWYIDALRSFGYMFESKDLSLQKEIADGILSGKWYMDGDIFTNGQMSLNVKYNPLNMIPNDPNDINEVLIIPERARIAQESRSLLRKYKIPVSRSVDYLRRGRQSIIDAIETTNEYSKIYNISLRRTNLAKYNGIVKGKMLKKSILDIIIPMIKIEKINEVKLSEDSGRANFLKVCPNYITNWKLIAGYNLSTNVGGIDRDVIERILRKDTNFPRNISQDTFLRVVTNPEIIFSYTIFKLVLQYMGISGDLARELYSEITRNAFSYLMTVEGGGYSSSIESLTNFNISHDIIKEYYETDVEFTSVGENIIDGIILLLIQSELDKDIVCKYLVTLEENSRFIEYISLYA
jgi:hypothetical protein